MKSEIMLRSGHLVYSILAALFANTLEARDQVIRSLSAFEHPILLSGSSFFIYLSELCLVACEHCMYSSDLTAKSLWDALDKEDL